MDIRPAADSRRWLWFALVLGASMLCGWQSQTARHAQASWPADVATSLLQPVESAAAGVDRGVSGLIGRFTRQRTLAAENAALRARLEQVRPTVEQLAEAQQEVARLRALLALREANTGAGVAARAVSRGPSPWFQTLTINAGRKDGLEPGAAVLAPAGLVGQVYQVSHSSARVLCLADRLCGIGARLQPTRVRHVIGVCTGTGDGLCAFMSNDPSADVRPGDAVVTSGQESGSRFPGGLLIGHVLTVKRRPDLTQLNLVIRPIVDADDVEEVLVLRKQSAGDAEATG